MVRRFVALLTLALTVGCADKLTGPDARTAVREYQSKSVAADTPLIFMNGREISVDSVRRVQADLIDSLEVIKPPKSARLYGDRAHHGVILIFSK